MKKCSLCKEYLLFEFFSKDKNTKDGYCRYCQACKAHKKRETTYGLSKSGFELLMESQNNSCAICYLHIDNYTNVYKNFHVDHDHVTGKVRGLLCHHCNTALGNFKDDIEVLNNAIEYLNK